ncbi:MAG: RNA polymerase sigma factor [Pseudomonadota bacterium]
MKRSDEDITEDLLRRGGPSQRAVGKVYQDHRLLLLSVALGVLRDRSAAEDAIQDAFVKTFAAAAGQEISEPRAYLVTAVRRAAIDLRARRQKNFMGDIDDLPEAEVISSDPQPDRIVQDREELTLILEAIKELPPQCRKVFIMNRIEGRSLDEISRQLHISKSTLHKHLAKGVFRCSEYLAQRGYSIGDGQKDKEE